MKIFFAILMAFSGLAGLGLTACGITLLQLSPLGLVLIVPALFMFWATYVLWKLIRKDDPLGIPSKDEPPGEE